MAYNKQCEHVLGPISGEASVLQEGESLRMKGPSTCIKPLHVKEEVLARPRLSFCCPHDGWGFMSNWTEPLPLRSIVGTDISMGARGPQCGSVVTLT